MAIPTFIEAPDREAIARALAGRWDKVAHVDCDTVLFLRELETSPKALAHCYSLYEHPIRLFTEKPFCIVVYDTQCDYLSTEQLYILILHEMMHIPQRGYKLVDHNVKDFSAILGIHRDWSAPGTKLPNVLEGVLDA